MISLIANTTTTHAANVGSISKHTAYYSLYFVDGLKQGAFTGLRMGLISIVVINLGLLAWGLL